MVEIMIDKTRHKRQHKKYCKENGRTTQPREAKKTEKGMAGNVTGFLGLLVGLTEMPS
jgi:hypothetical protein